MWGFVEICSGTLLLHQGLFEKISDAESWFHTFEKNSGRIGTNYFTVQALQFLIGMSQLFTNVEYKLGTGTYNSIANHPDIPICKVFSGSVTNPFISIIVRTVREVAGDVIDACFRAGEFKLWNVTFVNSSTMSVWPTGNYKTTFRFFDTMDANIANLTYETTIIRKQNCAVNCSRY